MKPGVPASTGAWPDCGCTDGTDPDEPADRGFICPHDPRGVQAPPEAFPCEHCHPEEIPGVRGAMARGETRIARATADAKADAEKRSLDALHDSIYRREGDPAPRPASEKAEAEVARLRSALEEAAAALHCGSCAEDAHNCPDHGNVHAKIDTALATASDPLAIGDEVRLTRVGKIMSWTGAATAPGHRTAGVSWGDGDRTEWLHAARIERVRDSASDPDGLVRDVEQRQWKAMVARMQRAEAEVERLRPGSASAEDWTKAEDGGVNSSPLFLHIAERIETMLRETRPDMIPATARLIVAQLAHVHGLAPRSTPCASLAEVVERQNREAVASGLEPVASPSSSPADVLAMFPVRAGECPQHGRFGPVCVGCVEARVRRETIEACAGHVRSSPSCSMEDIARRVEYLMASDTKGLEQK